MATIASHKYVQSRVDQKAIPPADDSFNDHGEEDSSNSKRKACGGGNAVRWNAVEGNEQVDAREDDRVLKWVRVTGIDKQYVIFWVLYPSLPGDIRVGRGEIRVSPLNNEFLDIKFDF